MQLGVYGCVLAPYDEWEILTMVKHLLAKKTVKTDRRRKKTTRKLLNIYKFFHPASRRHRLV